MLYIGEGRGVQLQRAGGRWEGPSFNDEGGGRTMDLARMNARTAKVPNLRLREVK